MHNFPEPGGLFVVSHLGGMLLLALGAVAIVLCLARRHRHGHDHSMGPWGHHHGWVQSSQPQPPTMALQILDERLARGDINVDDYLTRRSALLGDRPNGTEFRPTPPGEPQRATDPNNPGL